MSLRIRRGTDEQRQGVVFDSGELVVTTDQFKLFVGDGATAGGRNIATNLAGNGLTYNSTTQALDLDLNITTDDVPQGINSKYFSNELAQDAIGAALLAGNPTNTGISFVYNSSEDTDNKINAIVSLNLNSLSDVIIDSTPANGHVLKYNATQGAWMPALDSGGGGTGGGLSALEDDLNPTLGGNLALNGYNISGLGNISTTGTLYSSVGLGGDLSLNNNDITGNGNVNITGTITATLGLGADLSLNGYDITGDGNISTSGTLYTGTGLSGDLGLNGHNITGNGSVNIDGTINAAAGLGGDLGLNSYNITGIGNVNINGTITATSGLGGSLNLNNESIVGTGIINTTGYVHTLNNTSNYALFSATQTSNDATPALIAVKRSRGGATPVSVANDLLMSISAYGHDGTNHAVSSALISRAVGTIATGKVPGQLEMHTADANGTLQRRFYSDHQGTSAFFGRLVVQNNSFAANSPIGQFYQVHDNTDVRPLMFSRARGTAASPGIVQGADGVEAGGDLLGRLQFNGWNGSAMASGALISAFVDGTPIAGQQIPTRVVVSTSDGTGVAYKLTIYSDGRLGINSPQLVAGVLAGEVDTSSVHTYIRIKVGDFDMAIPAYKINGVDYTPL